MCIITFQMNEHPKYKLMIAANRDESYARPSQQAHYWQDAPQLLAGKDLKAGGTWLGITKTGKFAAITNYRDVKTMYNKYPKSRGDILTDYLLGSDSPDMFVKTLRQSRHEYGGFNVLLGTIDRLLYYSPQLDETEVIQKGVHSISNAHLHSNWPKMQRAKTALAETPENEPNEIIQALLRQLADRHQAETTDLPDTGISLTLEEKLSSIFIETDGYGTKCSTVLLITHDNQVEFVERTYLEDKSKYKDVHFQFNII